MPDTMIGKGRPALLDADGVKTLVGSYPRVSPAAESKDIGRIDPHMRRFIEMSPFCCLATSGSDGRVDVGPRGDPPGSFKVIDDKMVAIADRPGNNRLDGLKNILTNPQIGALFMIPGMDETVRVNGKVALSTDPELLAQLAVEGKQPRCAIVILVEEAFLHCAKAFRRSRLWSDDYKVSRDSFPSLACMIGEQLKWSRDQIEASEKRIEWAYAATLWDPKA